MLTDAEIESLAKEILDETMTKFESVDSSPVYESQALEDGEWLVVYAAESREGYGTFLFEYSPLEAVKKIVRECDQLFDSFSVTITNPSTGESIQREATDKHVPESRALGIRTMASTATFHLLSSFKTTLCDLSEDAVSDSLLTADAVLHAAAAIALADASNAEGFTVTADLSNEINLAAEKTANRRRELLRSVIGAVPPIRVEPIEPERARRGGSDPRIPVSDAQCITFAENYPILLQHWKGVASLRRQGLEWRGYAKLVTDTPDDLLDKLDNPLPQESDSEGADYPNIPSVLAHEHSARRCDIPPNTYKHSTLKNLRAKGDKLRSQIKNAE